MLTVIYVINLGCLSFKLAPPISSSFTPLTFPHANYFIMHSVKSFCSLSLFNFSLDEESQCLATNSRLSHSAFCMLGLGITMYTVTPISSLCPFSSQQFFSVCFLEVIPGNYCFLNFIFLGLKWPFIFVFELNS